MATRLKTISYCFANTTSNEITAVNTAVSITRTLYIPESGKTFVDVSMTGTGRIGSGAATDMQTRLLAMQLGSNTATTVNNAIRYTASGEHYTVLWKQAVTAQFTSFWGASTTSLPATATIQNNTNAAAAVMHNQAIETHITYTYDDTSATKIKTVMIPLNANTGNITAAEVTYDTVPALDTYLPEAGKTIRNIYVVIQGNDGTGANTTFTANVGNVGKNFALDPNNLASDVFYRKYLNCDALIGNTAVTHTFRMKSSTVKFPHQQAWMVVTYEYDEATTDTIMNSLMLPMELQSPGGANNTLYARGTREFWIQEPGSITTNRTAFYVFWNQTTAVGTIGMRIGTGSFVTGYIDTASALGGVNAAMCRKDDAFVLARGRNELNYDLYRTDTADFMTNLCGFWLVNYTSSKPAAGSCVANKTIKNTVRPYGTAASTPNSIFSWASSIPETEYFISAIGTELLFHANATIQVAGFIIRVEKTVAEGGLEWMPGYTDISQTDPETGPMLNYSQMRYNFKRFDGDEDPSRVDIKTSRRIEVYTIPTTASTAGGWHSVDIVTTYHGIQYNVAGTTANCAGGNVQLSLCRSSTGEVLMRQNVAANASFNFVWHDNTEPVFVIAEADGGKYTRSADDYAAV
jgi:hypothetical protein